MVIEAGRLVTLQSCRLLLSSRIVAKPESCEMVAGTVPDSELFPRKSSCKKIKLPMDEGISPERKLESNPKYDSSFRSPMLEGMGPVNPFRQMSSLVRLTAENRVLGRGPLKLFE